MDEESAAWLRWLIQQVLSDVKAGNTKNIKSFFEEK